MKRPDIVVLVAVWEFLTAFFALIGLAAIIMVSAQTEAWWLRQDVDFQLYYSQWIYSGLAVGGFMLFLGQSRQVWDCCPGVNTAGC